MMNQASISPVLESFPPIDGQLTRALSAFYEISHLEQSHPKLKSLPLVPIETEEIIESAFDGIYVTDGQGVTLRYNKAFCDIVGVSPTELLGMDPDQIIEFGYMTESATKKAIATKAHSTTMPILKSGKKALFTSQPILNESGEVVRIIGNARDMTELMRLKDELDKSRKLSKMSMNKIRLLSRHEHNAELNSLNQKFLAMRGKALKAASTDATILISGESGVGKDVLAKTIHAWSLRNGGPFIKINCASTPPALIESEYFGYTKGAFTGASHTGKIGLFALANGGTLFLDEIGELPLEIQAKLLAVLQDRKFTPVGGVKECELNARIIAATNRDIESMINTGAFRRDLFYRLNIISLHLPPLRERKEDMFSIVHHMLCKFNNEYHCKNSFDPSFLQVLQRHNWPGNIRELSNVVEQMVVLYPGEILHSWHIPEYLSRCKMDEAADEINRGETLSAITKQMEYRIFSKLLEDNMTSYAMAKKLGINQSTVIRKLKKLGLSKSVDAPQPVLMH